MLKVVPIKEVPLEIMGNLKIESGFWTELVPTMASMSPIKYAVYEERVPILAIGAYRPVLVDPTAEIWCLVTNNLTVRHLVPLRDLFCFYLARWHRRSPLRLVARADKDAPQAGKFLRFFGGRETTDGYYEVFP